MQYGTPIKCKNCGAMLTQAEGSAPILECEYCHAKLVMDGPSPAAAIQAIRAEAAKRGRRGAIVGVVTVVVIVGIFVVRTATSQKSSSSTSASVSSTPEQREPTPPPTPTPSPPPPPPIGKVVLTFGEKGTNAGQLTNARAFTVMPSGEIVIAEVDTGRVQVFDAKGVYQRVINVPPGALTKSVSMYGVGGDDKGHAVVSRDGDLVVFDVAAGKVAKIIRGSYPGRYFSSDVHLTPDGTIWAVTDDRGDYAIAKMSLEGKHLGTIKKAGTRRFAVDGVGTTFLIKEFDHAIEVRDPKGEIKSKFTQGNPKRGKLDSLDEIAIDGKGHLFVQESNRVSIFDTEGAFLAELDTGSIADLAVDRSGFLYVLEREKVTKYELTLPR